MSNSLKFSVIIVAAGNGSRLGSELPKQYIQIMGKTILRHTLDIFLSMTNTKNICIVTSPNHKDLLESSIEDLENITVCNGGVTRKDSVYAGLKAFSHLNDNDIILVHDAARPFVKPSEILSLIQALNKGKAATLATPIVDTLRYSDKDASPSRGNLWAVQTPQAFHYGELKKAHEIADNNNYTDDAGLFEDVKIVTASKENFKITLPEDLDLAEKILSQNTETRIGQGYDVHAFDNEDKDVQHIRLCGINIPHNRKLKGHSDADVALHALTDAILGAIGEGDIGLHFPPSNDAFKNMDSAEFVTHALNHMRDKGGKIININLTLICEAPKIGKHREKMKDRIAKITAIDKSRINIAATTTEKLGFTGRSEGIAAQAAVSISLPTTEGNI